MNIDVWRESVNRPSGIRGRGGNKLRSYTLFKSEFLTEHYCTLILPKSHRGALAKFRFGVAPIRLETGRYEGLPIEDRICPFCNDDVSVEDEKHVLLYCPLYEDLRQVLFYKANEICDEFYTFTDEQKLIFILNLVRTSAKTCHQILEKRSFYLYK